MTKFFALVCIWLMAISSIQGQPFLSQHRKPVSQGRIIPQKGKGHGKRLFVTLVSHQVGMFSSFMSLLGALSLYDQGFFSGVKVKFGKEGLYYDRAKGPCWWDYYFEPIHLGSRKNSINFRTINGAPEFSFAHHTEFKLKRKKVYELISKYIHVKPHIEEKVSTFVDLNFGDNFIFGVHYRGTDKQGGEAPRVPYSAIVNQINDIISGVYKNNRVKVTKNWKIFVATDEQKFLDHLCQCFPGRVIYLNGVTRSANGEPIHFLANNYKKGEDAVMDCLLLSRCSILIKTSSNLSMCSAYFNPDIALIHVSHRSNQKPLE